jgi:hypothetical protein
VARRGAGAGGGANRGALDVWREPSVFDVNPFAPMNRMRDQLDRVFRWVALARACGVRILSLHTAPLLAHASLALARGGHCQRREAHTHAQ